MNRRELLKGAAGAAVLGGLAPAGAATTKRGPALPVSVARCRSYELDSLLPRLSTMLDQVGGIGRLVSGKTVTVKVNLTGSPTSRVNGLPASRTFQTHPNVILAAAMLLDRAGARRIRFVEGTYQKAPIEEFFASAGWDLKAFASLAAEVDFEDTKNLGKGKRYHRVRVPWGGSLFPAYDLNHSYVDCDVYVSIAKLKNHVTAGVTLATKNNFGVTPTALYGQGKQDENTTSARVDIFHTGRVQPMAGLPPEVDPNAPRRPSYRVPRHTVDSIGIRPIDLSIIDGIETVSGGEGPWCGTLTPLQPGLLFAGRNPVCTDAAATAAMGYDPLAGPGTGPFPGDNHLALAAELGLGTNDPREIEIRGLPLAEARFPFRWEPKNRFD